MFKIHFFNSIWSDSILLEKDGHFALVDTASGFYYEALKEFLDERGVQKLDFVLLTHFHSDHYTNIMNVLEDYKVEKLYFREYTNLERSSPVAGLTVEEYNARELSRSNNIKTLSPSKTNLILIDGSFNSIQFYGQKIELVGTKLAVKEAYESISSPYYQTLRYSDNYNSVALFFKYNNHVVYLAGDITDYNDEFEDLDHVSSKGLKHLYEKYGVDHVEIYKSAHHGGSGNNPKELLELIKADNVVITNTDKWLNNWSTIPNIKEVNPDTKIYQTDHQIYTFDISEEKTTVSSVERESQFIIQGKD